LLQVQSLESQASSLGLELEETKQCLATAGEQLRRAREEVEAARVREAEKDAEVESVKRSLSSLQILLEEKNETNNVVQESIAERAKLESQLGVLVGERDQALGQARSRLQEAQDLRKEVSSVIEKKRRVESEVERLREHLIQVEEGYTGELVEAEDREAVLRRRVATLEDQVRVVSVSSSEATQSASEASTQLKSALEVAAVTRDKLQEELATAQAQLREKNLALRNLNLALEGFTRQRDNELAAVAQQAEARVLREQGRAQEEQEAARQLKLQLGKAQQGLEAATRLGAQLDVKVKAISSLKQEISARDEMIKNIQEKLLKHTNSQVGRVDRDLVKNLIVGYVVADTGKKAEVLRIIATVLDFSQEERERTGLDGDTLGWLGTFLGSHTPRSRRPSTSQMGSDQSIARAFIKFLEEESVVREMPTLPVVEMARAKTEQLALASPQMRGTPSPLLSHSPTMALPSLATPSPSILRGVLGEGEES